MRVVSTRWITAPEDVSNAAVLQSWRALSASAGKPFSSPEWLLAWWEERRNAQWKLRLLIAEDDAGLAAVVPLYAESDAPRPSRLRLLGQVQGEPGLWGYGPLLRGDATVSVLSSIAAALSEVGAAVLVFDALDPDDAETVKTLARLWPEPGASVVDRRREITSTLRIVGSADDWLFTRGRSWRGDYRRRKRRLAEAGGVVASAVTEADFATDFDALARLHATRWQGQSAWLTPHMERTVRQVIRNLGPSRGVRIWTARLDGIPIAGSLFASTGGTTVGVLSGYDAAYRKYGAGLLTWGAGVEDSFRSGDTRLDFGWGDEAYKAAMTNETREVSWCELRSAREETAPSKGRGPDERWQRGPAVDVADTCLHQLFTHRVAASPELVALVFGDEELTYSELDRRANRLAHKLLEAGVGAGSIVAVCLDRSIELVVTLLAILKAGGAYLPLDPNWPSNRKQFALDEVGDRKWLVVEPASSGEWAAGALLVDPTGSDLIGYRSDPPNSLDHNTGQLAYVNFTSGSTGKSKGVLIEHRGVLRLLDPNAPWAIGPGDRMLHLAPATFDAATLEIWLPLLSGATLVLAPSGRLGLDEICNTVAQQRISALWLTSGLFHAMVEAEPQALARVRRILTGGDVLDPAAVRTILAAMPSDHLLINGYGPTESTTFATYYAMAGGTDAGEHTSIPIGRPLAGTTLLVVDAHDAPCPVGWPGELCIGGGGLARGYLNAPELTAAKFNTIAGERFYQTGDLVAWQPDGLLAFHGRLDEQVKVSGHRVEPAEIVAALSEHPAVAAVVAVPTRVDNSHHPDVGDRVIVAYWKQEPGCPATPGQLREFLATKLPEALIPATFVKVDQFPLTPNGKLDRAALPPAYSTPPTEGLDATERKIHAIWVDILGHAQFGLTDNFFMVGGHSLQAVRLHARINEEFASTFPISLVIGSPTIREQAQWLSGRVLTRTGDARLVMLQPEGDRAPLFAVHGLGGTLYHFVDMARELAPHRPVLGLQPVGFEIDGPHDGVAALAGAYADTIIDCVSEGPIHLVGYSAGGWYTYAIAAALLERGRDIGMIAILDSHAEGAQVHRTVLIRNLPRRVRKRLMPLIRTLAQPPDGSRWAWIRERTALRVNIFHNGSTGDRSKDDPYVTLVRRTFSPPRLPLAVDLFGPRHTLKQLSATWRYYALGGVRMHPLMETHQDFLLPKSGVKLAAALESVMTSLERTRIK